MNDLAVLLVRAW